MDPKEVYEKAKATLITKDGKPTPNYQAYMKYAEEYKNKVKAYDLSYANALKNHSELQRWPIEGRLYHSDVDAAWDRWVALGFKNEIEAAINILSVAGNDPDIAEIVRNVKNSK